MRTIPAKEIYKLDGSVVPQLFMQRDGDIYFFDKINPHEGRFCRLEKGEVSTILEVGEGQGIINHMGEIYLLQIDTPTVISKYSLNGKIESTITMEGIFYDFKINESGYFICLGYVENETVVKIINDKGIDSGIIKPRDIMFGSCIALYKDDIYIGGFDEKNTFTLIVMNYIGTVERKWTIDVDSEDRIIGKIQRWKDYILLHIVGKYDSMVLLNTATEALKEIKPGDLGIKTFVDINLDEEQIQILDQKCIYTWNLTEILDISTIRKRKEKTDDFNSVPYQYAMYMNGLKSETIKSFKFTVPIFMLILGYLFYRGLFKGSSPFLVTGISLCCLWLINFTAASVKNIIGFMDKSRRIDELLNIYSLDEDGRSLIMPLIMAVNIWTFTILFLYPESSIILSSLLGGLVFLLTYIADISVSRSVKSQRDNISIELLDSDNQRFGEYVRKAVDCLKERGSNNIFIELVFAGFIEEDSIIRWIKSRSPIIGKEPIFTINNNLIKLELDFSKRDIKYSRYSILMDYISYLGREGKIKEIQIGILNKG